MNNESVPGNASKSEGLMYRVTAFSVFIVLVTLIVLVTISSSGSADETDSAEPDDYLEDASDYSDALLAETADAGQEYIDRLIFLGDSTTYGLRAYEMLSGGKDTLQVWTPTNGTLTLNQQSFIKIWYPDTAVELCIRDAVKEKQPEYLVITLGVNGIAIMGEEWFKSEYTSLIKSVQDSSPDTKIICQSIFPVARSYASLKSINNDKIDAANRWILEAAHECGVKYLDSNSILRDDEGWLPETYHNGDGLHLKPEGFSLVLDNLRTHAWLDDETKGN